MGLLDIFKDSKKTHAKTIEELKKCADRRPRPRLGCDTPETGGFLGRGRGLHVDENQIRKVDEYLTQQTSKQSRVYRGEGR